MSLETSIQRAINEAVRAARQRAKRDPLSLFESSDPSAVTERDKQDAQSADTEALKSGDVEVDDIITKLNAIRAGRSLRDDDIKANLEKYIRDLDTAERTALLAYLKGIEQIVSGQVAGDAAVEPKENPAGVKMKKSSDVRVIKPTIVKKPASSAGAPLARQKADRWP